MNGRNLLLLVLALGVLPSCARKGPPPGGPIDFSPPAVSSTFPDSGQARVPLDCRISIGFSERMERRTVEDWLFTRPPIQTSSAGWKQNNLILTPLEPLRPDTTYTVLIGAGARDSHGNLMGEPKLFLFSTGEVMLNGVVTGKLEGRRVRVENAMLYMVPSGVPFRATEDGIGRICQAGKAGDFRMPGIEPETSYDLFCFVDRNGNRAYDEEDDVLAKYKWPIQLEKGNESVKLPAWFVADPKEPGIILGSVGDSLSAKQEKQIFGRAVSTGDSTVSFSAKADTLGHFRIDRVPAGEYSVWCFRDTDGNEKQNPGEVFSEKTTVMVKPEEDSKAKFPPLPKQ
ncbi:MAG: Ig-like domain-containing protein [Candidatus Eisenbacteria bacterium]|nr:Ig-like domain-containing protein [Candidatus Eisenbacteria bacterium]